jgi:hypothetical protein
MAKEKGGKERKWGHPIFESTQSLLHVHLNNRVVLFPGSSGYRANRQFPGQDLHLLAFETQEISRNLRLSSRQTSFRAALPPSCRCDLWGSEPRPPRVALYPFGHSLDMSRRLRYHVGV